MYNGHAAGLVTPEKIVCATVRDARIAMFYQLNELVLNHKIPDFGTYVKGTGYFRKAWECIPKKPADPMKNIQV